MSLQVGTRIGPYEITGAIGAGGMGEVYRARDARLGRDVAIKILPRHLASDPSAEARFEREARAVAALSHPNILAIHDVGREGTTSYAVMELLDGGTLRERLADGRLPLKKAIDFALQIAQGLAAAHAKGIIHRDVKPENVFVTADGHVKVLDFGLAKLEAPLTPSSDATLGGAEVATDRGTVLGTVGYLSPEQAEGRPVDHRSDIFSLGAVLYELVAGARAFKGDSAIDTLHRIVHDDPPPLAAAYADAPRELQWVLGKCLAKDPDERYQSTRDLVVDLKNVLRRLDSSPSLSTIERLPVASGAARGRRRGVVAAAALAALVAVGAIAFVVFTMARNRSTGGPANAGAPATLSIERVTANGNVIDAALSPDAKYVAYVVSESGRQSLWLRQLATASTLELVPPGPFGFWGISFVPDGSAVTYTLKSGSEPGGAIYRIAALGGTPRKLVSGADSPPIFSPDGRKMAYVRAAFPQPDTSALMVANADGSGAQALATRRAPEFFAPVFFTAPGWSPDGTLIVCPVEVHGERPHARLVTVRSTDGIEQPFREQDWSSLGQATWMPDGSGLLVIGAAGDEGRGSRNVRKQVWWLDPAGGAPRAITADLLDYRKVSVAADGQSLVTVASDTTSSIWVVPLGEKDAAGQPARITSGKYDGQSGLAATADGRILYRSIEGGRRPDIWIMDEKGDNRRQLTTDGGTWPSVTADGRLMAFVSTRGGRSSIWTMGLDGEDARALENSGAAYFPAVAPDGSWVAYASTTTGIETLWKVPTSGGPARQIMTTASTRPAVSPDGRRIAIFYADRVNTFPRLAVIPADGGPPEAIFPIPMATGSSIRWTADGHALLHNTGPNDRANVWLQPLDGSAPRPITRFTDQTIFAFDRTPDGKRLVVARGVLSRDAVLIRNFR